MSFEDLIKLKEKLGAKVYNEAVFGQHRNKERNGIQKKQTRDNKNRPRVMGVKRPVPLKGKEEILAAAKAGPRDPRFDAKCGEFDASKFKENFSFVSEIKERELEELKERIKTSEDPKEQKKIKYLIQRLQNQGTEERKRKIREEVREEERQEIKKAKKEFKKPHYTTDSKCRCSCELSVFFFNDLVLFYRRTKSTGARQAIFGPKGIGQTKQALGEKAQEECWSRSEKVQFRLDNLRSVSRVIGLFGVTN